MSISRTYQSLFRVFVACSIYFGVICQASVSAAQTELEAQNIDPRLIEVVEIVQARTSQSPIFKDGYSEPLTADETYLSLIDQLHKSSISQKPEEISEAVRLFEHTSQGDTALPLTRVPKLYTAYAELLKNGAPSADIQASLIDFTTTGNWFERYVSLSLLSYIHGTGQEQQAALQKAQIALSLIPTKPNPNTEKYIFYAKSRAVSAIAHLHNLQGNSGLALNASLDYLSLTKDRPDLKTEVDLINNLIYSYSLNRNHDAQLYLSQKLLEIEKTQTSSVAGLSEMRISGVMNTSGRYKDGLNYAKQSMEKATHPIVLRLARVNEAIAFAGLGDLDQARKLASLAEVNLARENMLTSETRSVDLYLAFLLAQAEDVEYATQLYNRQLDIKAQKYLENNSRDTTAMLAELENSHERQAEREAAAARESKLQALTIKRQRNLNRALTGLSCLMGLAMLAGFLFTRYRGRVLRKLEIKTREAASAEKLKTEFLGMISHELRTPLNGIIGISDYLANYHSDPDIREKTGIVLQSGNELLAVVEALTDMARIDADQLEITPYDVDLGSALAAIPGKWAEKARRKGLTFTAFVDPSISQYHVDEKRVVQSINILLANAISFTESGRVHLHITATKTEPHVLTAIVADTGRGMSELVQSRLFTPFMQADTSRKRNHMGTGLSLAIAYALAQMMGGGLSVVSREARGSEFKLTFALKPLVNKPAHGKLPIIEADSPDIDRAEDIPPTPPMPESDTTNLSAPLSEDEGGPQKDYVDLMEPGPTRRRTLHEQDPASPADLVNPLDSSARPQRILIVDDINSNRDILRLILGAKGHFCREAADGLTALAALDRQAFDMVIMDIHMAPMDGVEAIKRIRASGQPYENIPVIALTADDDSRINAECMDAGANLFLTKPVKREAVFQAVDYLRQSQSVRILSRQQA